MHNEIVECAIVGFNHPVKGTGIFAFCIIKDCYLDKSKDEMITSIKKHMRNVIGPFAQPDKILLVNSNTRKSNYLGLPKTRSGKIIRRILRTLISNKTDIGDISTLSDKSIIPYLIDELNKIQ